MKPVLFILLILSVNTSRAQDDHIKDSAKALQEVIIKAYENSRKLVDVGAPVIAITNTSLTRFNNSSILPAMNNNPGIRMEERSPGSYRLNIRGSSLRSPFGVRNVKVYYNDIPYTDPGGNTYLNQLGFYSIQSMEIVKGPGSSIYGAGTGGVVLIRSDVNEFHPGVSVDLAGGSYNMQQIHASTRLGSDSAQSSFHYQHQASDGYRDHTAMRRDVVSYDGSFISINKDILSVHFLYADLYYQTPGALIKSEYDLNEKAARPDVGSTPGAEKAKAAIYQKTFLAGFSNTHPLTQHIKNITALYGAYSQMNNPSFRNYGRTTEPHFGGRTTFQYSGKMNSITVHAIVGAEYQQGFNTQRIYKNNNGQPDTLQTDDEIYNNQGFLFAQVNFMIHNSWIVEAGASVNKSRLSFRRLSNVNTAVQKRSFSNEMAPRLSILRKLDNNISVYACIEKGFSAPQTAELLPSTNVLNTTLQAEHGIDYELGTRGNILDGKLVFDITAFFYHLKNAIVQRRDPTGADYFENAGSAKQNGLESSVSYEFMKDPKHQFTIAKAWLSYTLNSFHYINFKQVNSDYSGNILPGIPSQVLAAGLDINLRGGLFANLNIYSAGRIALNDANTEYAGPYTLAGIKFGYKSALTNKLHIEVFAGADNLLDEKYSLGNDINAAGGRYFNAATRRNYYAGIMARFSQR